MVATILLRQSRQTVK